MEHEYTKKDDARDMDMEHEKIKTNIETDTVLLKNGIDEYQFKSNATDDIEDNNNVEAIMYE